MTNWY